MTEKEKNDIVWASGHYLFESLPNNFIDWTEKKLYKWIEQHAWQPFEYWEGEEIFDEIDTGISGSTAQKVGATMKRLSGNQQIITITHLPQVAAYGSAHWKVVKTQLDNETSTSVEILNDASRISEIARMLSGEVITNEALKQAEVLLYQ